MNPHRIHPSFFKLLDAWKITKAWVLQRGIQSSKTIHARVLPKVNLPGKAAVYKSQDAPILALPKRSTTRENWKNDGSLAARWRGWGSSGRVVMINTRAQWNLRHTWIILLIIRQRLVKLGRVDGHVVYLSSLNPEPWTLKVFQWGAHAATAHSAKFQVVVMLKIACRSRPWSSGFRARSFDFRV